VGSFLSEVWGADLSARTFSTSLRSVFVKLALPTSYENGFAVLNPPLRNAQRFSQEEGSAFFTARGRCPKGRGGSGLAMTDQQIIQPAAKIPLPHVTDRSRSERTDNR
jgi:hypothetical protein